MDAPVFIAIISIGVGFCVGIFSGLLGIGGGTVLVPIFKLGFGLSALASTATSLFTIIPTSISGAITHFRNKTCLPRLGIAAGIGGALTSPLGVFLASLSPEWAPMVAAAVVIAYSAITMFRKALKLKRAKDGSVAKGPQGIAVADVDAVSTGNDCAPVAGSPASPTERALAGVDAVRGAGVADAGTAGAVASSGLLPENVTARTLAIGAAIGLFAGLVSGYVGVGGGFIMVPMFMQLLGTSMRMTSGTSLIAVMILAIPGTVTQAALGNVDWVTGIFVSLGAIPGAALGSRLVKRVPELQLRLLFAGFLLIAAVMLVMDQVL